MEQSFLEAAEPATATGRVPRPGAPWRARATVPAWATGAGPWLGSAAALLILSYVIVRWAYTRPSFDSFGWLTWGYQTIHLSLNLGGAPSWKPLPWLFTTPLSLAGHSQVTLWMTVAVALALAGTIFAGRVAHRACETLGVTGRPAILAAIVAGLGLLGIEDYSHYILSAQSDPVIVTFVLAAIDCELRGRPRWAMACATLAALGRPEGWLLLGIYSVWSWRRRPAMRWPVVIGWVVILFTWFGIPTITNGDPNVSAKLALHSPRQLHHNIIFGTIGRFTELNYLPVLLMALGATALGVWRRNRTILLLAGGAVVWVLVEVAFALHGWAGLPRYMYEAGAIMPVLAGVLIGWVAAALPGIPRLRLPRVAGPVLAAVLIGTLVPGAAARVRTEHADLKLERIRTDEIRRLDTVVARLGGPAVIRRCGEPSITVRFMSPLAYALHMNIGPIGHHPKSDIKGHRPRVVFYPIANGWSVLPWNLRRHRSDYAVCRAMRGSFVFTARHPGGVHRHHLIRGSLA